MARQCVRQPLWALAAPLATAALLIAPGAAFPAAKAQAAPCLPWTSTLPPSPGAGDNEFFGVSALSACDVWAVGNYRTVSNGPLLSLAEHWNGTAWKQVSSPSPGQVNELSGVATTSATDVWAVGFFTTGTLSQVLAAHCC